VIGFTYVRSELGRSLGLCIHFESTCEWFAVGNSTQSKIRVGNSLSLHRESHGESADRWSKHENDRKNVFRNTPASRSRANGGFYNQDEHSLGPY
jgi:hypothetical protein